MDRFDSVRSLLASRRRARSLSLPEVVQPKRPRIENRVEGTSVLLSGTGVDARNKPQGDVNVELSAMLEQQEPASLAERLPATAKLLGSAASDSSQTSKSPSTVWPTQAAYEDELLKRNIFFAKTRESRNPENLDHILRMLDTARASPGPDEEGVAAFSDIADKTRSKRDVLQALWPEIMPKLKDFWHSERDSVLLDMEWSKEVSLQPHLDPAILPPEPDQVLAFSSQVFSQWPKAAEYLGAAMTPAPEVVWPYFTLEVKGEREDIHGAKLKNAYSGAVMLNNMFQLKTAIEEGNEFLDKIWVISVCLAPDSIQISGHFMRKSAHSGNLEYWSKRLHSVACIDDTALPRAYQWCMNSVHYLREETESLLKTDLEKLETMLGQGRLKEKPISKTSRKSRVGNKSDLISRFASP